MDDPMMNPAEVGKYLGVSEQRLARMRLEGGGPPFFKIGRNVRYRKHALDEWLSSKLHTSTKD